MKPGFKYSRILAIISAIVVISLVSLVVIWYGLQTSLGSDYFKQHLKSLRAFGNKIKAGKDNDLIGCLRTSDYY